MTVLDSLARENDFFAETGGWSLDANDGYVPDDDEGPDCE